MHSKCHNVTDPVAQNDYLVSLSNALYSIYSLWDVGLMLMCVPALSEQTNILWNRALSSHHHVTLVARLRLDRVFRWKAEIMN